MNRTNKIRVRLFSIFFFHLKRRGHVIRGKELEMSVDLEERMKLRELKVHFTGVNRYVALITSLF